MMKLFMIKYVLVDDLLIYEELKSKSARKSTGKSKINKSES